MAFYLMMLSVVNIIKNEITDNIEVINQHSELNFDDNIIILFLGDIQIQPIYKNKIILINTEHYQNLNHSLLTNINSLKNYYIWDFSPTNINEINKNYPNINTYYLPLLYNKYLESYYNQTISKKIDYKDKEYDILFMGTINNRRSKILDELKKHYNVKVICIEDRLNNKELFEYIENSKIVLNIFYYEVFVFDYYRNSLLLANNTLMVSEYPHNVDIKLEQNLIDFEKNMIFSNYEDIIKTVKTTLEKSPEEINSITMNTYEWFKKNDMKEFINNFFRLTI
jgi:hypothetical protein